MTCLNEDYTPWPTIDPGTPLLDSYIKVVFSPRHQNDTSESMNDQPPLPSISPSNNQSKKFLLTSYLILANGQI